jgi:hypothetical protein
MRPRRGRAVKESGDSRGILTMRRLEEGLGIEAHGTVVV